MPGRFVVAAWDDSRKLLEMIESFGVETAPDFVVFSSIENSSILDLIEQANSQSLPTDVIVVCDPGDPARRHSLRGELPPLLSLLAAFPAGDPAVAVSVRALREQIASAPDGTGVRGLTLRVAISGNVRFIQGDSRHSTPHRVWPSLTISAPASPAIHLRDYLISLSIPTTRPNCPDMVALRAGLLLLNDFLDDSHSCSQAMEGQPNADYWHAILHRREPDYGNAKYWFRRVGRHSNFGELAQSVSSLFMRATGSLKGKLERWQSRLIRASSWDPIAFVDLCETAESDIELRSWCEEVQFVEMMQLLTTTYRSVVE